MIELSYAPSLYAPLNRMEFPDIGAFGEWLSRQPPISNKTDSAIIVSAVFPEYPVPAAQRLQDNALYSTGAILDFDGGDVTPGEVAAELEAANLQFLIRPTFSSTPAAPRFFAYVPFSAPCPIARHKDVVEGQIRPMLNGHGGFARESGTPVQPRFTQVPGKVTTLVSEGTALNPVVATPAAPTTTHEPLTYLDTNPENRQLFRLCLPHIDPDVERTTWLGVLGCGLRMWGITTFHLKFPEHIGEEQWRLIADLEEWCASGTENKYFDGIGECNKFRRNLDGESVPSMVMTHGARALNGSRLLELTGVVKRTAENFPHLIAELQDTFPELIERARARFHSDAAEQPELPTEAEVAIATVQAQLRIDSVTAEAADYRKKVLGIIEALPSAKVRNFASTIACAGEQENGFAMNPAAAVVLSAQLIGIIGAHRCFTKSGTFPPLSSNLYTINLDWSGSGKSASLDFAMRVLASAGYEHATSANKVFSGQGLFNLLSVKPVLFYTQDEIKATLADAKTGGSNQATLDGATLSAWLASCHGSRLDPPTKANHVGANDQRPLPQPYFSHFYLGVPDDESLFTDTMMTSGALARCLVFVPFKDRPKEEERVSWVLEQHRRMSNSEATISDVELHRAGAMLKDFDERLEGEFLGERWSTVRAFGDPDPEENPVVVFSDYMRARTRAPIENLRILTCTEEAAQAMFEVVMRCAIKYSHCDRLIPFLSRIREKALRLAVSFQMFDDPTSTHITEPWARYCAELVALAEEPFWQKIANSTGEIEFRGNRFEKMIPEIKALLSKSGKLYLAAEGISKHTICNEKEFGALGAVIRKLSVTSENIRRDAQAVLDSLGIVLLANPSGKGVKVFHPDHAPKQQENEQ